MITTMTYVVMQKYELAQYNDIPTYWDIMVEFW